MEYHERPGKYKLPAVKHCLQAHGSNGLMAWVHSPSNERASSLKLASVLTAQRHILRCYQSKVQNEISF